MSKEDTLGLTNHQECDVLTGLTIESLPPDNSLGRARSVRKGADVWKPDDRSDGIFFLKSGQVSIVTSDRDGRELVLSMVEAGEPFGELCFCIPRTHHERGTYARAAVKSEVLEIKFDDFLSFLQTNRDALHKFTFTFCMRLNDCRHRIEFLSYRGAEQRLGRALLHIAATRGKPSDALSGQTVLPVSHDDLALIAAMTRTHVTLTMGKLRRRGLVHYVRKQPPTVDTKALSVYLTGIGLS